MAVFHAVERNVWKRVLLLVSLLLVAGLVYVATESPLTLRPATAPARLEEVSGDGTGDAPADDIAAGGGLSVTVEPVSASFFDEYRLERERSRSLQVEQLRYLIESGHVDTEREAVAELIALLDRTDLELQTESLLRARGLTEALVVIGDHGVIVVVNETIGQSEAHAIGSIVAQVTGKSLEHITISDGVRLP
jgi:hypothetical protein